MLYLIKFSLFSTVASKSLCCNIVDFRAKLNFGFKLNLDSIQIQFYSTLWKLWFSINSHRINES